VLPSDCCRCTKCQGCESTSHFALADWNLGESEPPLALFLGGRRNGKRPMLDSRELREGRSVVKLESSTGGTCMCVRCTCSAARFTRISEKPSAIQGAIKTPTPTATS
jgi:hypothetical protein